MQNQTTGDWPDEALPEPPAEDVFRVELDPWELRQLTSYVSATALTYISHHITGGLRPAESETMEKWKALGEKLGIGVE